ncbi:MAG: M64 family metallopeptidase [Candidatus Cryptobacteroides sp.]
MKKSLHILLSFFLLAGLFSCSKENASLSVSEQQLNFTAAGQKLSVSITAGGEWSAASDNDWIVCSPTSGSGNGQLSVTARRNDGIPRTGKVTVSGNGGPCTIAVSQEGVDFLVSSYSVEFDEKGTPVTLTVSSKFDWEFDKSSIPSWCTVSPEKGSAGNVDVVLTPAPFTDRNPRSKQFITLKYGTTFTMISVSQSMPNQAPEAPKLLSPEDNATGVKISGVFTWMAATDPDGDEVTYTLMLSVDGGQDWSTYESSTTSCKPSDLLSRETAYLWKVRARDGFGGESFSETRSFVTSDGGAYADGDIVRYQTESAGAPKPVHLIIMGDGYTKDDYSEGGKFDRDVDAAVAAFFTPEPFASYKNHFRITTIAVYSQESGATVLKDMQGCPAQTRNTAFSTTLEGGNSTAVDCDQDKAYSYALKVPGVTNQDLQNTTILMMVNLNVYAGTCWMERTGRSVSICPAGPTFASIVSHECGGHGFGRLLDEYRYYKEALPASSIDMVKDWRTIDPYYGYNISFTNDASQAHWGHFIGRSGYDAVGFYEGGMLYGQGVWRPEYISCMEDNRQYYNAPSREAIARRIFKAAGKTFSLTDFYANDKVKSDNTGAKTNCVEVFVPLAPPVMIDR